MVSEIQKFAEDFQLIKTCIGNGLSDVDSFQGLLSEQDSDNPDWVTLEDIKSYFNRIGLALHRIENMIQQKPLF